MISYYYDQIWYSNPCLRDWLEKHATTSHLDKLKRAYYLINKTPWYAFFILGFIFLKIFIIIITL